MATVNGESQQFDNLTVEEQRDPVVDRPRPRDASSHDGAQFSLGFRALQFAFYHIFYRMMAPLASSNSKTRNKQRERDLQSSQLCLG